MSVKYNNPVAMVISLIAFSIYITKLTLPNLNLDMYFVFPDDINAVKDNLLLILNLFTYVFYYSNFTDNSVFVFDLLILLLVSYAIERRLPYFIIVVVFLSIIFASVLKLFVFKDFQLHGLKVLIFAYLFSSLFIALKDRILNLNVIIIISLYVYLSIIKKEFDFKNISNYTEIIAAFLASISVLLLKGDYPTEIRRVHLESL